MEPSGIMVESLAQVVSVLRLQLSETHNLISAQQNQLNKDAQKVGAIEN